MSETAVECILVEVAVPNIGTGGAGKPQLLIPVRDGVVRSTNGEFFLSAEDADKVIAAFDDHGTRLMVDYEHESLGGDFAAKGQRPIASGWITQLSYDVKQGLFGLVAWTKRAAEYISQKEYCYLSPTVVLDAGTRHAIRLESVGLVNKPAIVGMPPIAAKQKPLTKEADDMPETTQKNQEEGAGEPDLGVVIGELKGLLGNDLDVTDDAKPLAILVAIRDALRKKQGGGEADEGGAEDTEVALSARKELGLPADAGKDAVCLAVNKLKDGRGEAGSMRSELDALKVQVANREADEAVDTYVTAMKLNPNEATQIEKARAWARKDLVAFKDWMETQPVVGPPQGKTTPPAGGAGGGSREQIIAHAAREYDDGGQQGRLTDRTSFVNQTLRDAKLRTLSADEETVLAT